MSLLISIADLDSSMAYYSNNEPEVYFYHGDHLGSASWKKERFGKPFASDRGEELKCGKGVSSGVHGGTPLQFCFCRWGNNSGGGSLLKVWNSKDLM